MTLFPIRNSPIWRTLARLHYEGWGRAYRRARVWRRILKTPPVKTHLLGADEPIEVHLMCFRLDHVAAIWALKSFYDAAGVRYPLVIHLQGATPPRVERRLRAHFPTARIINQAHADRDADSTLRQQGLTRLADARAANPMIMKLTDFVLFGSSRTVLAMDSDVLFFASPDDLLPGAVPPDPPSFLLDVATSYNVSATEARDLFGIELVERINCGLMLYARDSVDLARCNEMLARPEIDRNGGLTEQTLRALLASEQGQMRFFPETYVLSLAPEVDLTAAILRHYAGGSRRGFTDEGIPHLIAMGLLDA